MVKNIKKNGGFLILPILFTLLFLLPFSLSKTHLLQVNIAFANAFTEWVTKEFWQVMASLTDHLLTFFIIITKLSSNLFTAAADYSTRGTLYSNLSFINTVWIFIRDLVNSTFIFVVLYIAIKSLLDFDSPNTTTIKKTLVHIIIAALLINFSLFFTKVSIDVSNYLTRSLFCRMQTRDDSKDPNNPIIVCDPGTVLLKGMRFESISNTGKLQAEASSPEALRKIQTNEFAAKTLVNLLGTIVAIIAAISFFATAFMFIARIFILVLVMATSPIYFAAKVLDNKQVQTWKAQWEKMLTSQLVFPIVFMGILYIGVLFTRTSGFIPDGSTFGYATLFLGNASVALPIILNFGFLIVILLTGLKTARNMGGQAEVFGNKMSNFVTNKTLGMAGAIGRQTAGRAATSIANSEMAKKWANSDNKFTRFVGDKVVRGGKAVGSSSMDLRNSKAFGFVADRAGSEFGMKMDKGSDRSFTKNGREIGEMGPAFIRNKETGTLFGRKVSDDAKKRIAEEEKATIEKRSYSATAMALEAKQRLGSRFMDKEHKGTRDQIVKALQEEYKDKKSPADKVELANKFKTAFGEKFETDDEFKDLRAEITKDVRKAHKDDPAKAKDELSRIFDKTYNGKEFASVRSELDVDIQKAELKKSSEDLGGKRSDAKIAKESFEAAEQEFKANPSSPNAGANYDAKLKAKEKAEQEQKDAEKAFRDKADELRKANRLTPGVVADLAAKDIGTLRGQLTKAHMQAIAKKMQANEYNDGDKEELNKIIQEMLIDEKNENPMLKDWLVDQVDRDALPFSVDLTQTFEQSRLDLRTAPTVEERTKAESLCGRALRGMKNEDVRNLHPDDVLHVDFVGRIRPNAIIEYRKIAEARGDTTLIDRMNQLANTLEQDNGSTKRYMGYLSDNGQRAKVVSALRGVSGGGKKNRNRNK